MSAIISRRTNGLSRPQFDIFRRRGLQTGAAAVQDSEMASSTSPSYLRQLDGFSKKVENHEHSMAIHYMHYNFGRIHQSLRVTPAMEAGITDHVWSLEEIVALITNRWREA
jgi:hypothetical protein